MQILWNLEGASPLDLHQDSTMKLMGVCTASIHPNVLHNDGCAYDMTPVPDQEAKSMMRAGGDIDRAASPLSPHHWLRPQKIAYKNNK